MNSYSVPSGDTPSILYRVQNLNSFFNLMTFTLGIYSSTQRKIEKKDIIEHQKSAFLVGTTSSETSLNLLQDSWKIDGVLIIDPALIIDHIYNVNRIVKSVGTSFYTQINENERCMTILPVCTIKSIKFNKENIIDNPFYIAPVSENIIQEYQLAHLAHTNFLETLFDRGEEMTTEERQMELNNLICIYHDFYQNHLGDNNPFAMTLAQLKEKFGNDYFDTTSINSINETVKELMMREGDKIFMMKDLYKKLLAGKRYESIKAQNEEYGYGSRNSYSWG